MSNPLNAGKLNLQGAVDLGALAQARQAQAASAQAKAAAPAGVIIDVDETTFDNDVMRASATVPVIVDFWAEWCGPCKQLSPILEKLTAEAGGKILLAKIDSDKNQRLAQAFQVQSIPSVFLVIGGQVQPLFQGALPESQLRPLFEQILKVAADAGLAGVVNAAETAEAVSEPVVDPRFQKAYDAVEAGDWDAADAAYNEVLSINPSDVEAQAGLLQVALLRRTDGVQFAQVLATPPQTLDEKLLAADVLMLSGEAAAAFELLIDVVRFASGEERDIAKTRALELFKVMGETDEVRTARRSLTNALF